MKKFRKRVSCIFLLLFDLYKIFFFNTFISELCYVDASASFEPLNTSITLFYTSCAVGALPLALFVTSDEFEVMLEKAINLLKTILPSHAFFGRDPQIGPMVFMTDNSSAEHNALELCWPGIRLLCTFHILQAFW